MKKSFIKKIIVSSIVVGLFPLTSFAQEQVPTCTKQGYTIETINGIFTKEGTPDGLGGASGNLSELKHQMAITSYNGEPLTFDYLYNPTHGPFGAIDLSDVAIQKTFEGVDMQDPDFLKMLTNASTQIKTQKLLLVAHSQGNFYANNFYNTVTTNGDISPKSIGVYGVGSPAKEVAGSGEYLTSSTDTVINKVRKVLHGTVLKANDYIEYKETDDSGRGHGFREIYLSYRGEEIKKGIEESLAKLSANPNRSEDIPCVTSPQKRTTIGKVSHVIDYGAQFAVAAGVTAVTANSNSAVDNFIRKAPSVIFATWRAYDNTVTVAIWVRTTTIAVGNTIADTAMTIGSFAKDAFTGLLSGGPLLVDSNSASVILATIPTQSLPVVNANNIVPTAPATALVNNQTAPNVQQQPQTVFVFEPKVQSGTNVPKLVFVGSFSGGSAGAQVMGAQSTAPVIEEVVVVEEEIADNAGAAMATPALSTPQCSQTLATDGCLLATTTVHFEWPDVAGAGHYLLNKNGEYATTTEKSFDVEIEDFSDYIFEVVAVGADSHASATSSQAVSVATIPIAINEIAWMGTRANTGDEWFEIKNNTSHTIDLSQWELNAKDGTPHVKLTGTIAPHAYLIFERTDDTAVKDVDGEVYGNGGPQFALSNSGDQLILSHASTTFDQTPNGAWIAGENSTTTRKTMERYSSREPGTDPENWGTNLGDTRTQQERYDCYFRLNKQNKDTRECFTEGFIKNGTDADGYAIGGTPGAQNSVSTLINKGQDITADFILTTDEERYVIPDGGKVYIGASSTLTIEPGVTISFYGGQWDEKQILVEGRLDAQGTAENPIVFKPFFPDYDYQVGGVHFSAGTGTSTMEYVRFDGTNGILMTDGSHLDIKDSQFVNNYAGIESDGKNTIIINNTSFDNTEEEPLWVYNGGVVSIASSTITNTIDGAAIEVDDGVVLTVASTTIDGAYDRSNAGIEAYGANVSIINSVIRNTRSEGIAAHSSNVSIEGLVVSNTIENGIYLYNSTSSIANTIIESGVGYSGIAAVYGTLSVASSTIRNVLNDGIGLYSASSTILNTVVENGTGTGILIDGGIAEISDTTVRGFVVSGISVTEPVSPITISGGEITGNAIGVEMDPAGSAIIVDVLSVHDNGTSEADNIVVWPPTEGNPM